MSKRAGKKDRKAMFRHKPTCQCTKCRLANAEIVLANLITATEEILLPHVAHDLQKQGKCLILRGDGRYVVSNLPAKPELKQHPTDCTCQLCASARNRAK